MDKNMNYNNDNPWDVSSDDNSNKSNIVDFASKFTKTNTPKGKFNTPYKLILGGIAYGLFLVFTKYNLVNKVLF